MLEEIGICDTGSLSFSVQEVVDTLAWDDVGVLDKSAHERRRGSLNGVRVRRTRNTYKILIIRIG